MRSILVMCSVSGLLLGASLSGCVRHSEQPAVRTGTVVVHHGDARGVTEAQPAAPAAQPPEPQPSALQQMTEERARVTQGVTVATQQIDRLTRMQQHAPPDQQDALQSTIDDLQSRREKVMQDMRELEVRGPAFSAMGSDTLRSDLYRDLGDLQSSVRDSYGIAPPPGSGMPPPAPLPPAQLH